jgi:hypothetical protein
MTKTYELLDNEAQQQSNIIVEAKPVKEKEALDS